MCQRQALLRSRTFVYDQERLRRTVAGADEIAQVVSALTTPTTDRPSRLTPSNDRLIDMPAKYGKVADQPGFGVREARAGINVSSTSFQIGTAYTGAILQAGRHQRSGEAKGQMQVSSSREPPGFYLNFTLFLTSCVYGKSPTRSWLPDVSTVCDMAVAAIDWLPRRAAMRPCCASQVQRAAQLHGHVRQDAGGSGDVALLDVGNGFAALVDGREKVHHVMRGSPARRASRVPFRSCLPGTLRVRTSHLCGSACRPCPTGMKS